MGIPQRTSAKFQGATQTHSALVTAGDIVIRTGSARFKLSPCAAAPEVSDTHISRPQDVRGSFSHPSLEQACVL